MLAHLLTGLHWGAAAFGVVVIVLGGASPALIATFWLSGTVAAIAHQRARRRRDRRVSESAVAPESATPDPPPVQIVYRRPDAASPAAPPAPPAPPPRPRRQRNKSRRPPVAVMEQP